MEPIALDQRDALERILASLNEASLDDSRWNRASALIDEACGSKGNLLVFCDGSNRGTGVLFARFCYRGERIEEWERDYFRVYYPGDEHIPRLRQLPDSRIVHVTKLFSEEELKTSRIWNEAMAHAQLQNGLKVRLDGRDGSCIYWSFANPVDGDGWSSARTDMLARLLPHLRHFLLVRQALVQAEALDLSLDSDTTAIVKLDRCARIVAANDLALGVLRRGDELFEEGGHLRACLPRDDDKLMRLIARAIPPFRVPGADGSIVVTGRDGVRRLVLHAGPVQSPETDFRPQGLAALVRIIDARRSACVDPGLAEAVLGLTRAESEVAVLLAKGKTIREIAMATDRKTTTIRWHLRNVCHKLGVSRQLDVARIVLPLGGFPKRMWNP